jgi:hypothetical protein
MSIVQFTRFRVATEREPAVLASLRACHGSEPELRGACLARLDDGELLDIAVWAGQPSAEAFDDPAQPASRATFYRQIDELLGEECGVLIEEPAPQPSSLTGTDHGDPRAGQAGAVTAPAESMSDGDDPARRR